jgi:transglutaminase-like putative cysteine protease
VLSYAIALCGILPLFAWLSPAPRLVLVAGLAAGIWQDLRGSWPIKTWILNAAIVPAFIFYALQYSRTNPIQPVVNVLAIMLAVRLGGEKSGRYYLQIQALSLFCLTSSSLFDLSPVFLIYLSLMLLMVPIALVLLTFHAQDSRMLLPRRDMRRILVAGLLMPLASLPLLVGFFPVLPRTQIPLWNFVSASVGQTSGMTDRIEPGRSATISESAQLAFRAEMPLLSQPQPYWRGTVFNRIEGTRWVRDPKVPSEEIIYGRQRITQNIYPELSQSRRLIALDAPANIELPRASRSPDGVFELVRPSVRRLSYQAQSAPNGTLAVKNRIRRDFYLQVPAGLPASIQSLAEDIRRQGQSDEQRLQLLERYFRNNNYRYSLNDLPVGPLALEQFLFQHKQGHCEFFASAFGLLLRSAGVPARLVGGYLGGEYNDLGGYYLIREDRAHVWVEAFIDGKGWLRVDPSSFAINAGQVWGGAAKPGLIKRFRMALDSFDHFWNRAIISYDFERQVDAARNIGQRLQDFNTRKIFTGIFKGIIYIGSIVTIFMLYKKNRKKLWPSREERLLKQFYKRIERDFGINVKIGQQGLFELASAIGASQVKAFVDIYAGIVYRDQRLSDQEYRQLRQMLQKGFVRPTK